MNCFQVSFGTRRQSASHVAFCSVHCVLLISLMETDHNNLTLFNTCSSFLFNNCILTILCVLKKTSFSLQDCGHNHFKTKSKLWVLKNKHSASIWLVSIFTRVTMHQSDTWRDMSVLIITTWFKAGMAKKVINGGFSLQQLTARCNKMDACWD